MHRFVCALLDNGVQCSCLTIHFSSKLWQYFMDYLDELCSCSWQVSLDWRWSGKSSCLRWLSTTPQPGEWTGTEEQATSALGTGHLKNTHTHQRGWNRWACCRRYKHTWDRGSLSLTCAASENNSKYWRWHSCPNHLLNHDQGGLFMWVIWTMPDCFWNSMGTGTDHRIPLLPQKWPQLCLLGRSDILPPYHRDLHI